MNPAPAKPVASMDGPGGLDLNPAPPDPARLSKRAGILFLGVVFVVGGLILYGIYERSQRRFESDAYRPDSRSMTAATDAAKQILADVPDGVVGEGNREELTLPDDEEKGEKATPVGGYQRYPVQAAPPPPPPEPTPEERRQAVLYERWVTALDAPTAASSGGMRSGATGLSNLPTRAGDATEMAALFDAMRPGGGASGGSVPPGLLASAGRANVAEDFQRQNMQQEKEAFLERARKRSVDNYLEVTRVAPITRFVIRAGWDIPAVLEQAINSDLPGEIRALVRESVYDTASGEHLLIPQGARLFGRYNSQIGYGQNAVQIVWDRLIFPDASSIDLAGMTGQDAAGRSGFRHDVDNHYRRLLGFGLLTSIFSAGLQISQTHRGGILATPSSGEVAAAAVGREMAQLGAETTRRNLNVQPTIKVPAGFRFNVRVNRDLAFEGPYRPMRPGGAE